MSPARQTEREASVARAIGREHAHTGRPLQGSYVPTPSSGLRQRLAALLARAGGLDEAQGTGGHLNVRLYLREEQGQGLGV